MNALLASVKTRNETAKDIPSWGVGVIATVGHFYDGPLGNQNRLWESAKVNTIIKKQKSNVKKFVTNITTSDLDILK